VVWSCNPPNRSRVSPSIVVALIPGEKFYGMRSHSGGSQSETTGEDLSTIWRQSMRVQRPWLVRSRISRTPRSRGTATIRRPVLCICHLHSRYVSGRPIFLVPMRWVLHGGQQPYPGGTILCGNLPGLKAEASTAKTLASSGHRARRTPEPLYPPLKKGGFSKRAPLINSGLSMVPAQALGSRAISTFLSFP